MTLRLDGEIWGIEQLAEHLDVPISTAYRLANRPGFPPAVAGFRRNRRWLSAGVRKYLEEPFVAASENLGGLADFRLSPDSLQVPISVSFNSRKRAS
jgi:hypothetical protein